MLSVSVASVLKAFGLSEASAKAKLCEMVDGFCEKFVYVFHCEIEKNIDMQSNKQ